MTIETATAQDTAALAKTLATAFAGDPVWQWMVAPGPHRLARLERFFALEIAHVALPNGTVHTTKERDGAALVLPPDHWRMPITAQARHAPQFASVFRARLPRALGLLTKMEARHLREPHLYVAYVGVAPDKQGRGVGRRLMQPTLEDADRRRLPAYLEASSPDNARLYRRLGFVDIEEIRFAGSPPMALMRRDPV